MRGSHIVVAIGALVAFSGCGSDDPGGGGGEVNQVVELAAVEFAFRADARITIEAGDTVEFRVRNEGALEHQLEVLTDASRRLAMTEAIAPGGSATAVATFEEPGVYLVICDIDDHRSLGHQAEFEVVESTAEAG